MDSTLKIILIFFLVYGFLGLGPLYWASIAESRWERLVTGLMLIYYAAYLLTGLAMMIGISEILGMEKQELRDQLGDFLQYIYLASFIFSFLFGGVGANVVTSSLTRSGNIDISSSLRRIESKIDDLNVKVDDVVPWHKGWAIFSAILFLVGLGFIINVG